MADEEHDEEYDDSVEEKPEDQLDDDEISSAEEGFIKGFNDTDEELDEGDDIDEQFE